MHPPYPSQCNLQPSARNCHFKIHKRSRSTRTYEYHSCRQSRLQGLSLLWIYLSSLMFSLLLDTCHAQSSSTTTATTTNQNNDCHDHLYASDANIDRRVDSEEYVTFVKLEGPPGFLPDVESFVELPVVLQSNFYTLACLCRSSSSSSSSDCCVGGNAHISTNGTAPDELPTPTETSYLNLVCGLSSQAIDMAVAEQPPTTTPPPPSILPTTAPTLTPTTTTPTTNPESPTVSPTLTNVPTVTSAPTSSYVPVQVVVKTSYSILVSRYQEETTMGNVDGQPVHEEEEESPWRMMTDQYEPDLIAAMDIVAQQVGDEVNEFSRSRGTRQRQRQVLVSSVEQQRHQQQQRSRRLELLVDIPTAIDEIVNVGFTASPQWINGTFLRGPCPVELKGSPTDVCGEVTASISVQLTSPDDSPVMVYGWYVAAMDRAILMGDLGTAYLQVAGPDTPVSIASGRLSEGGVVPTEAPTDSGTEEEEGSSTAVSPGAIAGIAAGGFVLVLLVGYAITRQSTNEQKAKQKKQELRKSKAEAARNANTEGDPEAALPYLDYDSDDAGAVESERKLNETLKSNQPGSQRSTVREDQKKNAVVSTTLVDRTADPAHSNNLNQQTRSAQEEEKQPEEDLILASEDDTAKLMMAAVPYISPTKQENDQQNPSRKIEILGSEDISNSGIAYIPTESRSTGNISHESEGGWSERDYTSSMGTMSDDEMLPEISVDEDEEEEQQHAQVVSMGPDSPLSKDSPGPVASAESKFEALESAIVSGDWAAVGATAAALASMQDTQSKSDVSRSTTGFSSSLRSDSLKNSVDVDKAAQLDQLIEQGDWEAIILAAARFEAEATGATNIYNISAASTVEGTEDDFMVHEDNDSDDEAGYSESNHSSRSESAPANGDRNSQEKLRAEIRSLVELVVPEEVDHVDEMLQQFAGREDELVDTLVTMQERAEARKASKGAQSLAKGKILMP